jgi:hypothetical protein
VTPRIPPPTLRGPAATAPATAGRALQLARAGYAGALLRQPGEAIRVATGQLPGRRACRVARLLGARHLAQATLITLAPLPTVFMMGAGVDALHAASMVILAAVDRTARRAALTDAAVEAAFAATGLAVAVASGGLPDRRPDVRTYWRLRACSPILFDRRT